MNALALTFRDTTFHPVVRNNQPWLTAVDLAKALGYARVDFISRIYDRNKDEFTDAMTQTVKLTVSGKINGLQHKMMRIFSLRVAHLIAMFAKTKVAKEFRKWVLDILDQYTAQLPQSAEETLLPSEQQTLSEIVHKRAEGYGELQGKVLAEIWSRVHHKFRVARYSQLPRTQLSEAILYVAGMEIQAGAYQAAEEYITHAQYHELKHLVYLIGNCFRRKNQAQHHAWNTVRRTLPVEAAAKIPAYRYEEARALLKDLERVSEAFNHAVMALEQKFFNRHFAELPSELEEIEQGLLN
jgi:prophage antirepressor-like protein